MRLLVDIQRLMALGCVAGVLAGSLAGCRGDRSDDPPHEFFPGLVDQPKYKAQSQSEFFADGRTMRMPPPGVVAFGRSDHLGYGDNEADKKFAMDQISTVRADLLREDPRVYLGINPDGTALECIPVRALLRIGENDPVDPAAMLRLMERGRDRYNIYCIVCHGGTGKGDGSVGKMWSATGPANLQDPKYFHGGELGQDGHIFQVIRNGLPNVAGQLPALRMPGYGAQINERDAWAVVAYLRALQTSQSASVESVPESERDRLMRSKPAKPTTPPAPAPAAPGADAKPPEAGKGAAK